MPVREAAAAGRLVISTPVGDAPLRASQGIGMLAPIESHKYRKFVAETLRYYRDNPAVYVERCRNTQAAARQLDWRNTIWDWIELIETAKTYPLEQAGKLSAVNQLYEGAGLYPSHAECERESAKDIDRLLTRMLIVAKARFSMSTSRVSG